MEVSNHGTEDPRPLKKGIRNKHEKKGVFNETP
jgi:hypothetical protein